MPKISQNKPEGKEILPESIESFDHVQLILASPQEIVSWSNGEVVKPETINYRTQRPERDGLFCEKIFGPVKNYECACGKYKSARYKGIICDRCGVEVTHASIRRRRMGHIELAVPCAHIWYVYGVPSRLALVLDISAVDLEKVVYFGGFIIKEVDEDLKKEALAQFDQEYKNYQKEWVKKSKTTKDKMAKKELEEKWVQIEKAYIRGKEELSSLKSKKVISEEEYHDFSAKYGQIIKVGIGAEAIKDLLEQIDLDQEIEILEKKLSKYPEGQRPKRQIYRLRIFRQMKKVNIRPEWMIQTILPIIPPDLRPMVQLDGGRFAASDLNDLYRRVISRNNRLKRLIKEGAPEVILRNEKRMLQEAVDALLDNSARGSKAAMTTSGRRALRSLSDMLRGKQGRFRQNLLGKRVDYSGRSVIVVGPELKIHQCGVPKTMALEIFRPFVTAQLLEKELANNIKHANQLIEQEIPEVWEVLGDIVKNYKVLLNRAPTLHRLGIQAFDPVLVEGKAVRIHPLVCEAYNADFDGDQMAVFLPLSKEAQIEAQGLMSSDFNLLKPASGRPIISPNRDIVWGLYYLTYLGKKAKVRKYFGSLNEAIVAFYKGTVNLQDKIKVQIALGENVETSCGRLIFNQILPKELGFVNQLIDKKAMSRLLAKAFELVGRERAIDLIDDLKSLGFSFATHFGVTISMTDILIPEAKTKILAEAEKQVAQIESEFDKGMITEEERHLMVVDIWLKTKADLEKQMLATYHELNPVYSMVLSGSRGNVAQLSQLSGMKGLVVSPSGEVIDLPVKANYREGLDVLEYFLSSHGARKGRTDTALRTSEAGYLTRRLVDVAQDLIVTEKDCQTDDGIILRKEEEPDFSFSMRGRIVAKTIKNKDGETIVKKGELISLEKAHKIAEILDEVLVYSPLTCKSPYGVCQKCYGEDLSRSDLVQLGSAVGIMAAQAIGEPGTQLTMRTFHIGGVAGEDITQGLPRVEQIFEARSPKNAAILAEEDGKIRVIEKEDRIELILEAHRKKKRTLHLPKSVKLRVKRGKKVKEKDILTEGKIKVRAPFSGKITEITKDTVTLESTEPARFEWEVSPLTEILVNDKDEVIQGQQLTEGNIDIRALARLRGEGAAQKHIILEVNSVYSSQGQDIHPKHFEIIARRMFSKAQILDPGDSNYIEGQIIDRAKSDFINEALKKRKKKPMMVAPLVLGITRVALSTESFLSAASFQETSTVLKDAALVGKVDFLKGVKENVIIGKLIPAGSGFEKKSKDKE